MKMKDYSEIQESSELLKKLLESDPHRSRKGQAVREQEDERLEFEAILQPSDISSILPTVRNLHEIMPVSKEKRLEKVLETMCLRAGFHGALVADSDGLSLSAYKSPVEKDALAAFTPFLGRALERTAQLFKREGADNISLDIDYADKIVLRRLMVRELAFFLIVICSQKIDELNEIELSIEQIKSILQ